MTMYQLKDIQLLADAGKIKSAYALNDQVAGGWTLLFFGDRREDSYTLYTQRGDVRVFKGIDSMLGTVRKVGLGELTVKTA